MKHEDHLDGWRGLAIVLVLMSHFLGTPNFASGRLGVDLFLVLSGLLMSAILFEQRTPIGLFYRRRISRILPVFLLFLIAVGVIAHVIGLEWTIAEIAASLLFLRTYVPVDSPIWHSPTTPIVGHLWSLNVEEHAYVILALIAATPLLRRFEGATVFALATLCFGVSLWYWRHPSTAPLDFSLRTETAAIPLLLSAGYRTIRHRLVGIIRAWMPLVALVLGVACYAAELSRALQLFIAPFLLAFAVNHIGETYRIVIRTLSWKPLCLMGVWSYSIYLWQHPFYALKQQGFNALLAISLAMIVALASFYLFESPVRTWLNANWRPRTTATPSPQRA